MATLKIVLVGTASYESLTNATNFKEHITYYEQHIPRWLPLKCGHFTSNVGAMTMHDKLMETAQPDDQISAVCSLCDHAIFTNVSAKTIDIQGLNNCI